MAAVVSDLSRFHEAQASTFASALAELRAGKKRTHWMWFIFPQLASLGRSSTARHYGIQDLAEARAYLEDPALGANLQAVFQALLEHPEKTAEAIMGPVDALKLRSSATLFLAAGGGPEGLVSDLQAVLDIFYGGAPCPLTVEALA